MLHQGSLNLAIIRHIETSIQKEKDEEEDREEDEDEEEEGEEEGEEEEEEEEEEEKKNGCNYCDLLPLSSFILFMNSTTDNISPRKEQHLHGGPEHAQRNQ